MRQTTVRWIAIAIVGALIATIGVGVISGGGGPADSDSDDDRSGAAATGATEATLADGPHVVLVLCAGVECPDPDAAAEQELLDELDDDPRIASTLLVTSEQAYQLFLDARGDQQDLVEAIDPDSVPAFIELDLYDPDVAGEVTASYRDHEIVASAREAGAFAR